VYKVKAASHVCQDCNVKYLYEAHHKENYGMLTV